MQLSGTALPVVLPTKAMVSTSLSVTHTASECAYTSSGYFMSLREMVRSSVGLQGSDLLLYSRHFRSALHECELGLRAEEKQTLSGRA